MKDDPMPEVDVNELLFGDFDLSRQWGVPYDATNAICNVVFALRARVKELEESNRNLQVDHDQYQAKYRASIASRAEAEKRLCQIAFLDPERASCRDAIEIAVNGCN